VVTWRKRKTKQEYIYESRDKGVTVTRRIPMSEVKEYLITDEDNKTEALDEKKFEWLSHDELLDLGKEKFEQGRLREKYPALKEAWEKYLVLLNLIKSGK
tara:strand:- start:289 stop:588 length:300 start_codon:yes stop_codon:yes gene_type:complete